MTRDSRDPAHLAYVAGVIDSDGWIGVHRSSYAMRVRGDAGQAIYSPRVQVKQVEPGAIDLLVELFGGHRYTAKAVEGRRPMITWGVHSAACRPVLMATQSYLRIKRRQAINALVVCDINSRTNRRGFEIPDFDSDEPLVPLLAAAARAGRSPAVAYQSVRLGNIPIVREGRRVFVPESYIETWRTRPSSAPRRAAFTQELEVCYRRAKELNRVGARDADLDRQ